MTLRVRTKCYYTCDHTIFVTRRYPLITATSNDYKNSTNVVSRLPALCNKIVVNLKADSLAFIIPKDKNLTWYKNCKVGEPYDFSLVTISMVTLRSLIPVSWL